MIYVVLLIAVLSRIVPHLLHSTGANVTTVGAALLFFGAGLKPLRRSQALLAIAVLAATDYYLTVFAYGFRSTLPCTCPHGFGTGRYA